MHGESAYGLWTLVILNSVIFIFFAFSFVKPKTKSDWRSLGAFSAFVVALFTEMYGFPLSLYFFSGWLAERYPDIDFLAHNNGHLLHTILGFEGDPHWDPLHIASNILIVLGFFYFRRRGASCTGHNKQAPWPVRVGTRAAGIPTLVLFPVLAVVYMRLAKREEQVALKEFGDIYRRYMESTPAWIPRLTTDTQNQT